MPLDPRVKRFLDVLAAGKPPNALDTTVEERRLGLAELMKLAGPAAAVAGIEDRTLPGTRRRRLPSESTPPSMPRRR